MRIAHLATSPAGGAGIAARRLAEAQCRAGHDARLISRHDVTSGARRLRGKLATGANRVAASKESLLQTPLAVGLSARTRSDLLGFDVVHVHNAYNLINPKDMAFISERVPVVVTMHDERSYTGGCHHARSCQKFANPERACTGCRQVHSWARVINESVVARAQAEFASHSRIEFLAPSRWIATRAQRASVLQRSKIHVVRNPLNMSVFKAPRIERPRAARKFRIGFLGGQQLHKGWFTFRRLLEATKMDATLVFIYTVNGKVVMRSGDSEKSLSFAPHSDSEIARFWRSVDCGLILSTDENLPNALIECAASGRALIASDVGGISEFVGIHGGRLLSSSRTASEVQDAIKSAQRSRAKWVEEGASLQAAVVAECDEGVVVQQVDNVYRSMN